MKISLTIIPPFSPKDVELCHIERVAFSSKFDLVFVFKNSKKQFYRVKNVSLSSLDWVKDQLSSLAIKYTEGLPGCSFQESKTVDDLQPGGCNGDGNSGEGDDSGGGPPRRKKRKLAEERSSVIFNSPGEAERPGWSS